MSIIKNRLWFDVGVKRYTTVIQYTGDCYLLWFDVGVKRYTTSHRFHRQNSSCGLM